MTEAGPRNGPGFDDPSGEEAEYRAFGVAADDILTMLSEGREPDVEELARKYPKHAAHMRDLVLALVALRDVNPAHPPSECGHQSPGPSKLPWSQLGDYRILREIGRGGMGVVYEAEQISLNRRVALKVLPLAAVLDPRQLRRFNNEAQAAAHLQHQNIVPIYSVGCVSGVHYYAMQFIEGITLAEVIDELRMHGNRASADLSDCAGQPTAGNGSSEELEAVSPDRSTTSAAFFRSVARLGLQVAAGLQHAHDQGVVHRDIKPSNLLVEKSGNVWISDFGLARLEGAPGLTITGELLGTVRYMSPEQAVGKHLVLDHRSDIYSLGVTLYELLTLRPAIEGGDRRELLRRIAERDPPPPRRLNEAVPADLETVILKAMAKEPDARYSSAEELAADLIRFLDHRPIRAKRPTLWQRASKWSRRHRHFVASAATMLVLAVVGLSISTLLIWQEQGRTAEALEHANDERAEAVKARIKAEEEKALAEAVYEFMHHTLTSIDPGHPEVTLRAVLDGASKTIDGQFPDQPLVEAEVRHMIFAMYQRLGEYALAEPHARAMVAIRQRELGLDDYETLDAEFQLARLLRLIGGYGEAESLARRVYERRLRDLGEDHELTQNALSCLVVTLTDSCRFEDAEPLALRALQCSIRTHGEEHPETLAAMNNLALAQTGQGKLADADSLFSRVLEAKRQALGNEDPRTIVSLHNLAWHRLAMGEPVAAETLFREARNSISKVYGVAHPNMGSATKGLARALQQTGRFDEAEELLRQELKTVGERLDDTHSVVLHAMNNLAQLLQEAKDPEKFAEAKPVLQDLLRLCHQTDENLLTASVTHSLAWQLWKMGELTEAEAAFRRAVEMQRELRGEGHADTLRAIQDHAGLMRQLNQPNAAEALLQQALEISRREQGENAASTLSILDALDLLHREQGESSGH